MPATSDEMKYSLCTKITGNSEQYSVDIDNLVGKNRLAVDAVSVATNIATNAINIGTSATKICCSTNNLTNRKAIFFQNTSDVNFYIGSNTVTTSTGIEVKAYESVYMQLDASINLYGISTTTVPIRVMELA